MDGEAHHDILNGMGGIQSLGMMNALKTGDPRLDMIVALCLPFALRHLLDLAKSICQYLDPDYWKHWWMGDGEPTRFHERTISHACTKNVYGDVVERDGDSHNSILIKAIRLYCHTHIDLRLRKADLSLTTVEDEVHADCYGQSLVNLLKTYKMIKNPPEKEWHRLGIFGDEKSGASLVELQIKSDESQSSDQPEDGNNKNTTKSTQQNVQYTLRSMDGKALDAFLDTVYSWYTQELTKKEDHSRYYYDMETKSAGSDGAQRYYKRFRLSDEKSFDSLFFQEKEPILKLINDFVDKKGKYAIKGYPHKLGLLLTGPPGTGKTSLIKALAQYTGRSVVNVPLSKISTNAELMAQFFDKKYRVAGEMTARLDFKDVIFCLEDLDAASDIVKRRDGQTGKGDDETETNVTEDLLSQVPASKSLWQLFLQSSDATCQEVVKLLMDKSDVLKAEAQKAGHLQSVANGLASIRPGLGLVTSDNELLRQMGKESLEAYDEKVQSQTEIDSYLSSHAEKMKRLLERGSEIDDHLVETLLSEESVVFPFPSSGPSCSSKEEDYDDVPPPMDNLWGYGTYGDSSDESSSSGGGGLMGKKKKSLFGPSLWRVPDALNLTGILNALDGVVDCPGRIVIMTTNHPERLDKALIRPGRIDKKLYLGYMEGADVVAMLEHYFEATLDETQRQRVESVIAGSETTTEPLQMTPAQIECLTAEHDKLEDMIAALEAKAVPTKLAILAGSASSKGNQ